MSDIVASIDTLETSPSSHEREPDAHGQAALLLAESMLHTLIETRSLTVERAIECVRVAAEIKVDVAEEAGESNARMQHSLSLLNAIERSLLLDEDAPRGA